MQETHQNLRNPARFEALFNTLAERIYRYAVVQLRSREEAEDVTSLTFIRLWEYVASRPGEIRNPQAFLYRIAKHCIIDAVRRRKPTASIEEMQEIGKELAEPHRRTPEELEEVQALRQGLQKLRSYDRDLIIWRYIEGFHVYEIAKLLGISENATSVRMYRALRRLRKVLEK